MSEVALATSTRPSGVTRARAEAFIMKASQTPLAMPQPMSSRPSRMEPG